MNLIGIISQLTYNGHQQRMTALAIMTIWGVETHQG